MINKFSQKTILTLALACLGSAIVFVLFAVFFSYDSSQSSEKNAKVHTDQPHESSQISLATSPQGVKTYSTPTPEHLKNNQQTIIEQTISVSSGDSLSTVLSDMGISQQDVYRVANARDANSELLRIRPGQDLSIKMELPSGKLTELLYVQSKLKRSLYKRQKDGQFSFVVLLTQPETKRIYKEVTITNSIFRDGIDAGIPQSVLIQLTQIFAWDIDFATDLRKGDSFSLLYEENELEGEVIGAGNILAANFINAGRSFQTIRYDDANNFNYYTPDGLSMRKAFIRSPVDFTRISSKFNPNRLHPIFKTTQPHQGVDYAAKSGTPVKAAGAGTVIYAGELKGYGNTVILEHGQGYSTLYAHLQGFKKGLKANNFVEQGDTIAYVGQTGWATGPHLHFEFRINGIHKDPITVSIPHDAPMSKNVLKRYLPYARTTMTELSSHYSKNFSQQYTAVLKRQRSRS
ncbi:M23 family metallopeptidase [Marinomonas balearica]|uniref:Murein DD-endopeptidase MepM/ murein hydrolase activator NlpD n=1 Tax=Marinomonas balearica TaxID=491947 RepID=A0A4R6M5H0_9GAMM|nr:peptidoglycan DD-metalloendopeptidase family protein [Marinomonas balearica]TDO96494.1 murein DD-endopeptidase MepM/ murein hydrolase activator NlpD [Marinomonas balearica]